MRANVTLRVLACWILIAASPAWGREATAATAEPDEPGLHALSGTVVDPGGEPVTGAQVWVRVSDQTPSKRYEHDDWLDPLPATTDAAGRFAFELPVEGPYRLCAVHEEHPPACPESTFPAGGAVTLTFHGPVSHFGSVADVSGDAIEGADVLACRSGSPAFGEQVCLHVRSGTDGGFAFDRLSEERYVFQAWAPGKTLSAIKTLGFPLDDEKDRPLELTLSAGAEISGSVVDDTGTPQAGITISYQTDRVRLRQVRDASDTRSLLPKSTDDDGNFSFRGLPAEAPLKIFARFGRHSVAESDTIELKPGSVTGGVSIVYRRPGAVTFHVIDGDDNPVNALEVLWRTAHADEDSSRRGFRTAGVPGPNAVEAVGEGRFSVSGIEPKRYDLTLLPEGFKEIAIEGVEVPPGGEIDLGTRVARPGAMFSGRVIDDLGMPVGEAEIQAMYAVESVTFSRSAKSGEDGRFALGGLSDGPLMLLNVKAEGHTVKREQNVPSSQHDYEIVLDRTGSVRGRIVLESGDPAVGTEARLEPVSQNLFSMSRLDRFRAWGDAEGSFEISDAAPGAYHLHLSAKGVRPHRVKDIEVTAGEITDVGTKTLEPGLEIRGTVLDRASDSPIAGAGVVVNTGAGAISGRETKLGDALTDENGDFVVAGLETGRVWVEVEHVDYAPERQSVALAEDAPVGELTFRLGQGGLLRGTVLDEESRPSPGRTLGFMEGSLLGIPGDNTVRTNDAGEYRIERVRPGSYRVMLYPEPGGDALDFQQKNATVREGEETVVDFGGSAKIRFSGRLVRDGRPVGEVTVMLVPVDTSGAVQMRSAQVDFDGRFDVGLNRPGTYQVVVQDLNQGIGAIVARTSITIPDEPAVSREIVLQSGTIAGTVTDASGQTISGSVVVTAIREGAAANAPSAGSQSIADSDGRYRLGGIEDGTYLVSALADGYEMSTRTVTVTAASPAEGIDFRLESGGSITGRVVDDGGHGVPGALVFVAPSGTPQGAGGLPSQTDSEGRFKITAPSRGPCDITAIARGFAPGQRERYVPDPDTAEAVVTLTRGGTIVIHVVDADGRPREALLPVVEPVRSTAASIVALQLSPVPVTDSAGISRVTNLPPGSYRVGVSGRPEVPLQTVDVGEGVETPVTLQAP